MVKEEGRSWTFPFIEHFVMLAHHFLRSEKDTLCIDERVQKATRAFHVVIEIYRCKGINMTTEAEGSLTMCTGSCLMALNIVRGTKKR